MSCFFIESFQNTFQIATPGDLQSHSFSPSSTNAETQSRTSITEPETGVVHFHKQNLIIDQQGVENFSVHVARSGQLYDFNHRQDNEAAKEERVAVESVDDVAWRAQTHTLQSLPALYANLSKIRLTSE